LSESARKIETFQYALKKTSLAAIISEVEFCTLLYLRKIKKLSITTNLLNSSHLCIPMGIIVMSNYLFLLKA